MFFSTTLVDFLDQAVQKFQETAKKFDQYVEKANKEEYVCLNCFESRFRTDWLISKPEDDFKFVSC